MTWKPFFLKNICNHIFFHILNIVVDNLSGWEKIFLGDIVSNEVIQDGGTGNDNGPDHMKEI